jgi:predicted Ser/Thr protein kinase
MSYLAQGTCLAGRYRIDREIGRGGHSVVYAAHDAQLDTDVAVKLLVPPPATLELARERLRREVLAVRHLTHEHIVPIYDYLTEGPWQFVVMRLVDGQDLEVRVRERGPVPADEAASLAESIASALTLAHQEGILHRDVKPRNILIEKSGKALLTDFGSARILNQGTMTETGGLVGTLAYSAPELMAGHRADARSDVYALGLTLYYALTGRLPAQGSPHLPPGARPEGYHPRAENFRLPQWLDAVVARATAADPAERFPTASSLGDALAQTVAPTDPVAVWNDRCLVCGALDPEGLTVCSRCGPVDQPSDHFVFLAPGHSRDSSESAERLLAWFGRAAPGASHRAVAQGLQPLARVPGAMADTALDRLATRGFSARSVPVRAAWRMIPVGLWAVSLSALGLGLWAGSVVHPYLLYTSPWVAGLLLVAAGSAIRTPLLNRAPRRPRLGGNLDQEIVATAAELPDGTARELFAGVVRLARLVMTRGSGESEHQALIQEVIPVTCRGARELARLDEGVELLESQAASRSSASPDEPSPRGDLERRRDLLVQRFLDTQAGLQRLLVVPSGAEAAVDEELRVLAGALERDASAWEAAEREVARVTG